MNKNIFFCIVLFIVLIFLVGCGTENELYAQQNKTLPITNIDSNTIEQDEMKITTAMEMHFHKYNIRTIEPTCVMEGSTVHFCECGDKYVDTYVSKTEHTFTEWQTVQTPTFLKNGKAKRCCVNCDYTETKTLETVKIKNDKAIILHKPTSWQNTMIYPKQEDFGCYYDNAIKLYNGLYRNSSEEVHLIFDNETYTKEVDDYVKFKETFEETVLLNKASVVKTWFVTGALKEGAGLMRVELIPSDTYELQQICYNVLIDANVKTGDTQLDAVIKINNWIIENVSYVKGNLSAIDTAKEKTAQCAGYAELFMALCQSIGIDVEYVTGCVDGNPKGGNCYGCHAWNKVKLGGNWYYIDVCWNDSSKQNCYFLSQKIWDKRVEYNTRNFI